MRKAKKKAFTLGIIGCGNMGSAIIRQHQGALVFDKDVRKTRDIGKRCRVRITSDIQELVRRSAAIIMAVKPQDIDEVLKETREVLANQLVISIAAGITTRYIEDKIGRRVRVVRVMPNIAAHVKSSISALCRGRFATGGDLLLAEGLFQKLGKVIKIEEGLFDAFTAIAGSGPAYLFYFIEALSQAGEKLGFCKEEIDHIVKEVVKGSIKLLEETGLPVEDLRKKVTSKRGTTEAAIRHLERKRHKGIVEEAVIKAARRAKQLSQAARRQA